MVDDSTDNKPKARPTRVVGQFIRSKREALGLSQRALGQLFLPPVTTQFISNIERGVTPLPTPHLSHLAKALQVTEAEFAQVLEREFTIRLSEKLGKSELQSDPGAHTETRLSLSVPATDYALFKSLLDSYLASDTKTREAFLTLATSVLKLPQSHDPSR